MRDTETNIGGYPATKVYEYLRDTLYGQLPADLQSVIADTRVISGHGPDDSSNFTTNDKLYLLSGVEVFKSNTGDTAEATTNLLEYYQGKSNLDRIKQYNGTSANWWLRLPNSYYRTLFSLVNVGGGFDYYSASYAGCLAPAFRIA